MRIAMKCFYFEMTEELYKQASHPIRTKEDIIALLVNTIKLLVSMPAIAERDCRQENKIILFVDKMSRLFFCMKDKIFTVNFPFSVFESDTTESITIRYRHVEIDSYLSSLIISVFVDNETYAIPMDDMKEFVFQHMAENGWDDADPDDVCEIIKKLAIFEAGYLRYDHDEERANGRLHPENHIDFCYESSNEIKVGIDTLVDYKWMIDLANINTECKFLK